MAASTAATSSSTYSIATISEPSPWIFARTLDSNRSRAMPRIDSLTMTPDTPRLECGHPDERPATESRQLDPCRDDGLLDQVWRDLHAPDELAGRDDLAVEDREHLQGSIRLSRSRSATRTFTTPETRAMRSTRLCDGPRVDQTRPADRRGQTDRRLVLVKLATVGDQDGQWLSSVGRGDRREVVTRQPAALRPALRRRSSRRARGPIQRAGPAVAGPE